MQIGIRNGSLKMDYLPAVGAAAELGFDGVELDIQPDYADSALWNEAGRRELREAAKQHECDIASLCLGALWSISPANPDAPVRAEARALIAASARVASDLEAKWILVPVTPGAADEQTEQAVAYWIEEMTQVAAVAQDLGITYCLENVGRGCGKSAGDLLRLVNGIGSPAVGAYYDIGNAVLFGNDPVAEIEQLGDHARIIHVKDHGDYLGCGDVPIAAALRAAVARGYDDYLVFETGPTDNPMRAGAFNLGFTKGVLAAL